MRASGPRRARARPLGPSLPERDVIIGASRNAGIARTIHTTPLDLLDTAAVIRLVDRERIDLTVVGPEAPLANGLVDSCRAAGLPIFGPTRAAAQLETSKAFAKDFMQRHDVPTHATGVHLSRRSAGIDPRGRIR